MPAEAELEAEVGRWLQEQRERAGSWWSWERRRREQQQWARAQRQQGQPNPGIYLKQRLPRWPQLLQRTWGPGQAASQRS